MAPEPPDDVWSFFWKQFVGTAEIIKATAILGGTIGVVVSFLFWAVLTLFGDNLFNAAGLTTIEDARAAREEAREAREAIKESITRLSNDIAAISRRVTILAAPDNVLVYDSVQSRPLGDCVPEEGPCEFFLRFRRAEGANECDLLPNSARYTAITRPDGERWEGTRTNTIRLGEVTDDRYTNLQVEVSFPSQMTNGQAELQVTTFYSDCAWQNEREPPAQGFSMPIQFAVK